MSEVVLYHNPQCSKSRKALRLLQENGIEPRIVKYLEEPLTQSELKQLLESLNGSIHDMIRENEPEYQEADLSPASSEDAVIDAIVQYPKLLQRPIALRGENAVIGRPSERVLGILE